MVERSKTHPLDFARTEEVADMVYIRAHLPILLPEARQGYVERGRGAIVVDTNSVVEEKDAGQVVRGHPYSYFTQEMINQHAGQDTQRLVTDYDPTCELVAVLLKAQGRISQYRVRVEPREPSGRRVV